MPNYDEVLREYVTEMRDTRAKAIAWWEALVAAEASGRTVSVPGAPGPALPADLRWPLGPASHPRVIAVYRKYFLLIDDMNEREDQGGNDHGPDDDPDSEASWGREGEEDDAESLRVIQPHDLLLENVKRIDEEVYEFVKVLAAFVPIGMDPSSRFV